ncbi:MAG: archease [Deltaproteobacteria bacterium]|nr:archease [Deltaproteobacteria bacterium]
MLPYKMFDHTADIGVEILGRTKKELFANAAGAIFDILIERHEDAVVSAKQSRKLIAGGTDVEDLLINFLRELLYLFNGAGWVVEQCKIMECSHTRLTAEVTGEPYHPKKHSIKNEIKAVTYSGLSVTKQKAGWKARVIFDV